MYSVSDSSPTNVSTSTTQEQNCRAVDERTGNVCGETEGLQILDEFRNLYEARIEKVDKEFEFEADRTSAKIQIMSEWIQDLGEQNVMLVRTVEDLEQAACSRVKVLEEKLRQSSKAVTDSMTKSTKAEESLSILTSHINQLENDSQHLQGKIEYLQSDIKGLLKLIRRARCENCWKTDDIQFFEVRPDDIPAPSDYSLNQVNKSDIAGKDEVDRDKMDSLNREIKQLRENEKEMISYQRDLEKKLSDLTDQLAGKEEVLKKYVHSVQCLSDKLKNRSTLANQVILDTASVGSDCDIMTATVTGSTLAEKDLALKNLQRQLEESNAMLVTLENENKQLTSKEVQRIKSRMSDGRKESVEIRDALKARATEKDDLITSLRKNISMLEEQSRIANMHLQFKDDIIRKMRKELKHSTVKDSCPTKTIQMERPTAHCDTMDFSNKDKIVSCLMDTKLLMERQSVNLCDLKMALAQILERENTRTGKDGEQGIAEVYEKLHGTKALLSHCSAEVTDNPESMEHLSRLLSTLRDNCTNVSLSQSCEDDVLEMLSKNMENIDKMCSEKKKAVACIDSIMKDCHEVHMSKAHDTCNTMLSAIMIQHLGFMQEFRFCSVEAQAATEDIREEIDSLVATFNSRHQKYMDLANTVTSVQDQLKETRKTLLETINRLELREEEQSRHSEQIVNGEKKLKDLKNNISRVQSDLASYANNMQAYNVQKHTGVYMCDHLLKLVVEEVDEVMDNLQAFQAQGRCTTSALAELKRQLSVIESTLKELQVKTEKAVLENNLAKVTFADREKRLSKLEAEVDSAHTKMHEMVEVFEATKKGSVPNYFSNNQAQSQFINDILKTKEDLRNVKKEYHNYKLQTLQRSCEMKYNESVNQWKSRITDLEDRIKGLQDEVKCKEETNSFLKHSIESLKKELLSVQTKSENHRRCHTIDSLDLKQKIFSLESTLKAQQEVESNLRISLNNKEVELQKLKERSDSHLTEYGSEELLVQTMYPTNISQLFKLLQDTIQSTKGGLQELKANLKKMVCQDSSSNNISTSSVMFIIDLVEKYEENPEICSREIEKLKCALRSKDKLLEHRDERIKIQKGSIEMMQAELKELSEKSQQKVDVEALISKYEREKQELAKQNELQNQTIRHLQDAVVEAKRSLDQKAQKGLQERDETIFTLRTFMDETQSQYNNCFAEAAKQDKLMDLQRDAIQTLQERIRRLSYDKCSLFATLRLKYDSILNLIQYKLCARASDLETLKCKVDIFSDSKSYLEQKYADMKKLCQQAIQELQELKCTQRNGRSRETQICQCGSDSQQTNSNAQDLTIIYPAQNHGVGTVREDFIKVTPKNSLQLDFDEFIAENNDLKEQLKKCQLDIQMVERELKSDESYDSYVQGLKDELQQIRCAETYLTSENNQLKLSLQEHAEETVNLSSEPQHYNEEKCKCGNEVMDMNEIGGEDLGLAIVESTVHERDKQLERLAAKAGEKQEELKILETLKKEFEKIRELEQINALLRDDLIVLKSKNNGKDAQIMQFTETIGHLHDNIELQSEKMKNLNNQIACNEAFVKEQLQNVQELQSKLDASNQRMDKCLSDLNTSKKVIFILQHRVHSLTALLKQKSDAMVKLEADHEVSKNNNVILERQMRIFETAAKDDVRELKKKLKHVEAELHCVNVNYERAAGDFHKTQKQLVDAARREAELQESLTIIEKDYCHKLISAEREGAKLTSLVSMLTDELSDGRMQLSQAQDTCKVYVEQFDAAQQKLSQLEDEMQGVETTNYNLAAQLQECLSEKRVLARQKLSLERNNYRHVAELEDTRKSLAILKKECHLKNLSLACMTMNTSELRNESQYMVSCIRTWMNEQKDLIEHLTSKLSTKQQRLTKVCFEKRALLAIVRELRRANNVLMQKLRRTRRPVSGKKPKCTNANNYTTPSLHALQRPCARFTSASNRSNVHKKCCVGAVETVCHAPPCHNSWELPKMEQLMNELRKNNRWWRKDSLDKERNEVTALEENHDCGYQSSTSK